MINTEITGRSVDFNVELGNDSIYIWNEFDAESGIVYSENHGTKLTSNLEKCIDYYFQTIESNSRYLESEEVYQELDVVLADYPLIPSWLTQIYHTSFKNLS